MEPRSWPAPARLVGQRIAVHAGKRRVGRPGHAIERELRARWGDHRRLNIPTGAVVVTAVLAGMAREEYVDLPSGHAVHVIGTETWFAGGAARTRIDPWVDFSAGRWTGLLRTSLRLPVEPELPAHILLTGE